MDLVGTTVAIYLILKCIHCLDKATDWTYSGAVGQSEWAEFFPDCGGVHQSPINVETSRTLYDPTLMPVQPMGYNQPGNKPFMLSNNGHTIQLTLPRWMGVAGLQWHYSTVQLHLHWGNGLSMTTGSEHTINGQSALAELHIVHYNAELYADMSEAKTQDNGLAVLAILIEAGEEVNQAYANIFNFIGLVQFAGQEVSVPAFDIQSLLPRDLARYFRYNGSLTTPPCHQSVTWTIFHQPVKVSHSQLLMLQTVLYSSKEKQAEASALQDNYRTTQLLNHRTVLSSFTPDSFQIYTEGKIAAIVIGSLCGCLGLTVSIYFIVKILRSTSSWNILSSLQPMSQSSKTNSANEQKQDLVLNETTDPGKPDAVGFELETRT